MGFVKAVPDATTLADVSGAGALGAKGLTGITGMGSLAEPPEVGFLAVDWGNFGVGMTMAEARGEIMPNVRQLQRINLGPSQEGQ